MCRLRPIFDFSTSRETLAPRVFVMLIAALGLILVSAFAYGASNDPDRLSPPFDTCYETRDGKVSYVDGLASEGWIDVADRVGAIARLTDAFLPINVPEQPSDWAGIMAYRASTALPDANTLTEGRAILEQEGATLLLAGYRADNGDLMVECAIALPDSRLTDNFFDGADQDDDHEVTVNDGYRMMTLSGMQADGTEAAIYVIQLVPETDPVPPLAASNAVLTRLTIPAPSN